MVQCSLRGWSLGVFALLGPLCAKAQADTALFAHAHGLYQERSIFYEVEGYGVFVQHWDLGLDEKGLKKVARTYDLGKDVVFGTDSLIAMPHRMTRADLPEGHTAHYLFPRGEGKLKVVGFSTRVSVDRDLERTFAQAVANGTVPDGVITDVAITSIPFAGRMIELGPACRWMAPHNVQCTDMGQMNWSECRTLERAQELIDAQYATMAAKTLVKVREREEVDILFEGVPTKAIRSITKVQVPQVAMGSNVLHVYFVAQEVRGRSVACVLSHYTDDVNAQAGLPPLLREVMELK